MGWIKRGVIFTVDGRQPWMARHAQIPVANHLDDRLLRVYFASRDAEGRSRIGLLDTDPGNPASTQTIRVDPVVDLGRPGTFDDSGTMPSCVVEVDGTWFLYYVGWTRSASARHRTAIGLAVSRDDGVTFSRLEEEPVVDLTPSGALGTSTCFVLREARAWRMWYTSTVEWVDVRGHLEEVYVIKYAESDDGVVWRRTDVTCISPRGPSEASGRPWVMRDGDRYRMWYSYRDIDGFREDPRRSYRIGYAESDDGVSWRRMDESVGIGPSPSGWDSEMIAYPSVYEHQGKMHLLYNGNGFGASGIGHAVEED